MSPAVAVVLAGEAHGINYSPMGTRVFSSSVGTKLLIGITGLALFLYLLIHIGGNLLVFFGPDVFNRYAYIMEEQNALLPAIELGLLAVVLIHVFKTVGMFFGNQQARPVGYQKKRNAGGTSRKSLASSTMIVYFRLLAGLTSFIWNL